MWSASWPAIPSKSGEPVHILTVSQFPEDQLPESALASPESAENAAAYGTTATLAASKGQLVMAVFEDVAPGHSYATNPGACGG